MGHTPTCDLEGAHAHVSEAHDHPDAQNGRDGHAHDGQHDDHAGHGHSHGLVDRSIVESRDGVKTVSISLAVLTAAAVIQTIIFVLSGSVALLADLIHNYGDGLTAIPLGIAFYLRSGRGERWAGLAVVGAILVSALVALYETIQRLIHPQHLTHLWVLAGAGIVGFIGNSQLEFVSGAANDSTVRRWSLTATTHESTHSFRSAWSPAHSWSGSACELQTR